MKLLARAYNIGQEFQKYVILDSNETITYPYGVADSFQKYVILDSNETSATYCGNP